MRKTDTCTMWSCLTWVFPTRTSYLGGPVRCFNGCTSMFCDLFWYISRHLFSFTKWTIFPRSYPPVYYRSCMLFRRRERCSLVYIPFVTTQRWFQYTQLMVSIMVFLSLVYKQLSWSVFPTRQHASHDVTFLHTAGLLCFKHLTSTSAMSEQMSTRTRQSVHRM